MSFTSRLRRSALGITHPLQDGRDIVTAGIKLLFPYSLVGAAGVSPGA